MQDKLLRLQKQLAIELGYKIDVYREEGKGVLAVKHGEPLHPLNVIFTMSDRQLSLL
jgi:hypothetical protein